tara:strand:+ start:1579 stop:2184 length:606 start_codon:yes stop_codon:yes gene_type:complete
MTSNANDQLKKLFNSSKLSSKLVNFEKIKFDSESDAALIVKLRGRSKTNYLKVGSSSVSDQLKYLENYNSNFLKKKEIYYKIFDKNKNIHNGLVRITELNNKKKFNWESLVFAEDCTPMAPIDVMMCVYKIGFDFLDRDVCGPWAVDKKYNKMMKIHDFCKMYSHNRKNDESYHWIHVEKKDFYKEIDHFYSLGLGLINYE